MEQPVALKTDEANPQSSGVRPSSALSKLTVLPPIGSSAADQANEGESTTTTSPLRPPSPTGTTPTTITDSNVEVFLRKKLQLLRFLMAVPDLVENAEALEPQLRNLSHGTSNQQHPSLEYKTRLANLFVDNGFFEFVIKYWRAIVLRESSEWLQLSKSQLARYKLLTYMLISIWNCTDMAILDYLKKFDAALTSFYLEMLDMPHMYTFVNSFYQTKISKCILGSFHNMVRNVPDSRAALRESGAVAIVSRYTSQPDLMTKTNALLVQSYIVSESEQHQLVVTEETIKFVVGVLRACVGSSQKHYSGLYGFVAEEVVEGLNHLAVADANKAALVKCGVLPLYAELLKAGNEAKEQAEASKGLWTLAFNDDNRQTIAGMTECMNDLRSLCSSSDERVRRAAEGALWAIEGENKRVQNSVEMPGAVTASRGTAGLGPAAADATSSSAIIAHGHIMLSYNWGVKAEVIKIKDKLKDAGYKVWIDIEQMKGSTLDAMASAVEQASLVLIFFTENYKMSPSCRSEAEYCYKMQKPFIPIRMQPKYIADGWLGIIFGSKFFYDFTKPETCDSTFTNLCSEIDELTKVTRQPPTSSGTTQIIKPPMDTPLHAGLPARGVDTVEGTTTSTLAARSWTEEDVRKWLSQHGLQSSSSRFDGMSGAHIVEMQRALLLAPTYFYNLLDQKLGMSLKETMTFTMILRELT